MKGRGNGRLVDSGGEEGCAGVHAVKRGGGGSG